MRKVLFFIGMIGVLPLYSQEAPILQNGPVIHPMLKHDAYSGEIIVSSDSIQPFKKWLRNNHPEWSITETAPGILSIRVFNEYLSKTLTKGPGVKFIDRGGRKAVEEAIPGEFDHTLNAVTTAHSEFPEINGKGTKLSVKEKPFNVLDLDLRGRIDLSGPFDEPYTDHATFMATIAAGAGNLTYFTRGGGWGATITTSDFDRLLPDLDLTTNGVTVQNHSYGVGVETYYGVEAAAYDEQVYQTPHLLHVFSSGNKGNSTSPFGPYTGITGYANLTGQFKVSKNTLAVGSSDRDGNPTLLSSAGPVDDGRIKPELIAIGDAGSSEAAAVVSGIALLIQDAWKKKFTNLPDASMIKAIMINSANDTGPPGPDHKSGYGNANALEALKVISNETHASGVISQNEERKILVSIPAGIHKLKVTLAWTDPPAPPFSTRALQNDLDLTVIREEDQFVFEPWILQTDPSAEHLGAHAVRGVDHLNNLEQVTIDSPAPGNYYISVKARQSNSQVFHIAYSFPHGLTWNWPSKNVNSINSGNDRLRWSWAGYSTKGNLEYRILPFGDWTTIDSDIDLSTEQFKLPTISAPASVQFKIQTDEKSWISDTLSIVTDLKINVGYNCDEELMLNWKPAPGAIGYTVYGLADQYLESLNQTKDTLVVIPQPLSSPWFSVAPDYGNGAISRPNTIDYRIQGTSCYTKGFYSTGYLFENSPEFILDLSSVYKLSSVILQRLDVTGWVDIMENGDLSNNSINLKDPSAPPGISRYRSKIIRNTLKSIFSNETEVIVIKSDQIFLFPNPVTSGETINIVSESEESINFKLYDLNGRLLKETNDFGPVKEFDTDCLSQGGYLLRITESDGRTNIAKIIIN